MEEARKNTETIVFENCFRYSGQSTGNLMIFILEYPGKVLEFSFPGNPLYIISFIYVPFPSYALDTFRDTLRRTCHVRRSLSGRVKVIWIHGRRNVASHQRRPHVKRTCGCRDISSSKASRGRVGWCWAAHTQIFLLNHRELASLFVLARKELGVTLSDVLLEF